MNLTYAGWPWSDALPQEPAGMANGKAQIGQSALVAAPRGIANHHRQDVQPQVIVVGPPDCAADQKSAIAATQVQNHRSHAAKDLLPIQAPLGREALERRLRPLRRLKDCSGNGNAEFPFYAASFFHGT
jgi:hypothetical protein